MTDTPRDRDDMATVLPFPRKPTDLVSTGDVVDADTDDHDRS